MASSRYLERWLSSIAQERKKLSLRHQVCKHAAGLEWL